MVVVMEKQNNKSTPVNEAKEVESVISELEYIQRPKEQFKANQLANNMPKEWDEKTNIVFEHMFDIGFENGMNWQKNNWINISEYKQEGDKRNKVLRWHKIWKCPVAVFLGTDEYVGQWLEATLSTVWPEEAFEPFYMNFPSSPL